MGKKTKQEFKHLYKGLNPSFYHLAAFILTYTLHGWATFSFWHKHISESTNLYVGFIFSRNIQFCFQFYKFYWVYKKGCSSTLQNTFLSFLLYWVAWAGMWVHIRYEMVLVSSRFVCAYHYCHGVLVSIDFFEFDLNAAAAQQPQLISPSLFFSIQETNT